MTARGWEHSGLGTLFTVRYEDDEALFIVRAISEKEAFEKWNKNRLEAGCGDLPLEGCAISRVEESDDPVYFVP